MKTIILCFLLLAAVGAASAQTEQWKTRECKSFTISPAGFNGWYVMRGDIGHFDGAYISIRSPEWSIAGADNGQGHRRKYETAASRGISGWGSFQTNAPDRGLPETMTGQLSYSTLNFLTVRTVTIDWYATKVMPGDPNACEKAKAAAAATPAQKAAAEKAARHEKVCAPFEDTLARANKGNADAQYKVAQLYWMHCGDLPAGTGVFDKYSEWMRKAAANGHPEAKGIVARWPDKTAPAEQTSRITIAANGSSAAFEPMESKFRTAFNAAADSKARGKALGVLFGDVYKSTSLTDEQKKTYLKGKTGEVYALDKEAVFWGFMKAECSSKEVTDIMRILPADQKAFIAKRATEVAGQ